MIGQWIDGLTDEQKDRIVRATEWRPHKLGSPGEPRCLTGHAFDITITDVARGHPDAGESLAIGVSFDDLVHRFGIDRIVRACKLRAAATTASEVERAEGAVVTP